MAKTQAITAAPPNAVPNALKNGATEPKKRGRPRAVPPVQPSTSNGGGGGHVLTSESPDSGILSTVSPAPSPAGRAAKEVMVSSKKKSAGGAKAEPKYSLTALEKSSYATERTLYPPRRKKPGRPPKEKKHQHEDNLDPLWKKIDLNKKFREPCLDGYKSDGGQSMCCSKRLAAQSGYVSEFYGGRGRMSGYKSDHSSKSRHSGYRSDVSRAKSCGYRSDCGIRHRKKVRRKRRKKIGIPSKNTVDELSDILQLSALTLGTNSSTSSSQESIPTVASPPRMPPPKKSEIIPLQTFNGLLNASKPKFGASTVTMGQASAFGKKLNIKQSPKLTLSRANVQKNDEELSKSKFATKEFLNSLPSLASVASAPPPTLPPAAAKQLKSIDGRSTTKSRRTSRPEKSLASVKSGGGGGRRFSTMSRCSSRSTVSRHHFKHHRRRKRLKSRSMSVADKVKDTKLAAEIEELSESLKAQCRIYADKKAALVPAKRGPKKRKQSEALEPKRRAKKANLTQSPDDHKLPLKKRHYLLTNGEKTMDEEEDLESSDVTVTAATTSTSGVTNHSTTNGAASPKKRLFQLSSTEGKKTESGSLSGKKKVSKETVKDTVPAPVVVDVKSVTKKLRSDPSNFRGIPDDVPIKELKEPKKPGRKPKAAPVAEKKGRKVD